MRIEDECSQSAAVVAECSHEAVRATPNEPAIHLNPGAYPKAGLAPVSYREHYFPGTADECWDDWQWQYRNRITTLAQLDRFFPLPEPGGPDVGAASLMD